MAPLKKKIHSSKVKKIEIYNQASDKCHSLISLILTSENTYLLNLFIKPQNFMASM